MGKFFIIGDDFGDFVANGVPGDFEPLPATGTAAPLLKMHTLGVGAHIKIICPIRIVGTFGFRSGNIGFSAVFQLFLMTQFVAVGAADDDHRVSF